MNYEIGKTPFLNQIIKKKLEAKENASMLHMEFGEIIRTKFQFLPRELDYAKIEQRYNGKDYLKDRSHYVWNPKLNQIILICNTSFLNGEEQEEGMEIKITSSGYPSEADNLRPVEITVSTNKSNAVFILLPEEARVQKNDPIRTEPLEANDATFLKELLDLIKNPKTTFAIEGYSPV